MYRIIYTKQAAKDIKNLKSCGLDKKARDFFVGCKLAASAI